MQWMIVLAGDVVPCQFMRNRGRRNLNCFSNVFLFLVVSLHDRDGYALVKAKICHSWLSPSELLGFEAPNNLVGSVGLSPEGVEKPFVFSMLLKLRFRFKFTRFSLPSIAAANVRSQKYQHVPAVPMRPHCEHE
ncbi:hypothetical protein RB2351 [Rhodopirellula baltica SH 1]|uniref:Uncharacterized protein n=1 Tax=Rhodopirellula baltica (strain DSM 10527 / NCIMB 13988 / SH1) TaxID=243090 RepID=Q7UVZ6_RHOBA|nr:hypothetical protein RB2351 [Rhodopirellula baltica SH 1]